VQILWNDDSAEGDSLEEVVREPQAEAGEMRTAEGEEGEEAPSPEEEAAAAVGTTFWMPTGDSEGRKRRRRLRVVGFASRTVAT
jgi:hypothetical protein